MVSRFDNVYCSVGTHPLYIDDEYASYTSSDLLDVCNNSKVVAIGGGAKTEDGKLIPMDVKVGDKVLFGKWSGTEVKIDGKEYSIMKESDIMGIATGK